MMTWVIWPPPRLRIRPSLNPIRTPEQMMKPYISFVVVSRNDNHGGDLNARTQAFISGLTIQSQRHKVPIELIIVEWNPPADRKPLSQIYDWGKIREHCAIRVITVSRKLHDTFEHAKTQHLYQMIGKNVGIRRAEGDLIVATNIDIIFDDNIFAKFRDRAFLPNRIYVTQRTDVAQNFPYNATFDDQLQFCRTNILRLHTRYGSTIISTGEHVPIYSLRSPRTEALLIRAEGLKKTAAMTAQAARDNFSFRLRLRKHELTHYGVWLWDRWMRACIKQITFSEFRFQLHHYLHDVRKNNSTFVKTHRRQTTDQIKAVWADYGGRVAGALSSRNRLRLFTNACGDFTMMDRASWGRVHGYAEYDMFSMHIDGLLIWQAHAAGIRQIILEDASVYHIEHAQGSGFTPEYQEQMWDRIKSRGIPFLTWQELHELFRLLVDGEVDYRLSSANWGFEGVDLPEVRI